MKTMMKVLMASVCFTLPAFASEVKFDQEFPCVTDSECEGLVSPVSVSFSIFGDEGLKFPISDSTLRLQVVNVATGELVTSVDERSGQMELPAPGVYEISGSGSLCYVREQTVKFSAFEAELSLVADCE